MSDSFLSTNDPQFWEQVKQLDELREQLDEFSGLQVTLKAPQGEITIPFVRFSSVFPKQKS